MDFDSPDVEKDFPGLYAAENADGKSRKSKEDSDYSEGEHDKVSKKDLLIGRRKDKKDKGKDRGYAALEGESSPEEVIDPKSPSKSKKSKTFKFTSSKSKEKREKSRDKEHKDEDKMKDKDKLEKEKEHKKKDKERKDKDKKEKSKDKDKDKKEKKSKAPPSSNILSEEVLELGYPVFGVSISIATDRSRCHDGIDLPLVLRDCIDYLQEHGLKNEHIYKVEPVKTRLLHFKRLYNNRERHPDTDVLDVNTSCALLRLFLRELPEPVLTTDLIGRFEEVAAHTEQEKKLEELRKLLELLPKCNQTLLSWLLLHFDAVVKHEKYNKLNSQTLAMLLSPPLQMSHRLLILLLTHCTQLFPNVQLIKYVPPLTSSSPKLPDNPEDIQIELRKQESLLTQLHAEMNAGFVTKKREEQLWEVQRIITQLKRKLRIFEKKQEKSVEEVDQNTNAKTNLTTNEVPNVKTSKSIGSAGDKQNEQIRSNDELQQNNVQTIHTYPSAALTTTNDLYFDESNGFLMVPKTHPDFSQLIRLQVENQELIAWKTELQKRISTERAEILLLKQLYQQAIAKRNGKHSPSIEDLPQQTTDCEYDKIIENYVRENTLLENKKQMLAKDIFEERRECVALQVELAMQQY